MNDSLGTPSDDEKILANFVAALEKDGTAAIDDFAARHPPLADEFRSLAVMGRMFHQSRTDAEPAVPERLGEFRIVRRIGRGGMGEIYEAVQDRLKRRVAVKVIRHGKISPDSGARFLREQTILARLHQTHIVPIHTAGEHGPLQYFAMPYIEGATLSETIQAAREQQTSDPRSKTPPLGAIAGKLAADSRQRARPPAPTLASPVLPAASTGDVQQAAPDTPPFDETATISTTRTEKFTLSMEYFRSAAQVLADAALALHHAHVVQILHRDVKPSNIMVDKSGQCWIIDFGLAGYVNQTRDFTPNEETIDFQPEPITSAHIKGTPQYMAPEQFDGQGDVRTDVWGLGVTLYELLTLRRAFEGRGQHDISRKIQLEEPTPPRQLVPNLPADLAAICRKAMNKDAARRYSTAEDFAADLNRWLRHEPVHARPTNALRRAWLWSKRNKGWAAAIVVAAVAFVAISVGSVLFEQKRTAAAQQHLADVEDREREQERALWIQQIVSVRGNERRNGWSDQAWKLVRKAAEIRNDDDDLRNQAAASLIGLDAFSSQQFAFNASSVAFDQTGRRLLIGGEDSEDAKLADGSSDPPRASGQAGPGLVAFQFDGTPLQLVAGKDLSIRLWNVATRTNVRQLDFGANANRPSIKQLALNELKYPLLAISANATQVAAVGITTDKQQVVAMWETASGKELFWEVAQATALSFSPEKDVFAFGDDQGRISLRNVATRAPLTSLPASRTSIRSLAFSTDGRRLAVGDSGGTVTIWNLGSKLLPITCRGSNYDIYALAFSPDGTILASAGRSEVKLWDAASSQLILNLNENNLMTGLAFSPDGQQLAVSSKTAFNYKGKVTIWRLQDGRGMRRLRGLGTQVARVQFSSDGLLVAGLSHDWDIGIWDIRTGRLKRVLPAPQGSTADNAGLAFSRNGGQFAFAAGKEACLWDIASGGQIGAWPLPEGFADVLRFHHTGKLLLFRVETEDGEWGDPVQHPRVCCLRDLQGNDPTKPVAEIRELNWGAYNTTAPMDASFFVVEGFGGQAGETRQVIALDGPTGNLLWRHPVMTTKESATLLLDPSGKLLACHIGGPPEMTQLHMPSGQPTGIKHQFARA
jgi:serine/threonine protein kinase/WD40 repeat protein